MKLSINQAAKEYLVLLALFVVVGLTSIALLNLPSIGAEVKDRIGLDVNNLAAPTPVPLRCVAVRVPGYLHNHQLCTMPDGTQCLFYNSETPVTCYPEVETR